MWHGVTRAWVVGWGGDVAWGDGGVGGRVAWRCGMGGRGMGGRVGWGCGMEVKGGGW